MPNRLRDTQQSANKYPRVVDPEDLPIGARTVPVEAIGSYSDELKILSDSAESPIRRSFDRDDTLLRRTMGVTDLFASAVALLLGYLVFGDGSIGVAGIFTLLLVVPLMKAAGLYDRDANLLHKTTLEDIPSIAAVSMALTMGAISLPGLLSRSEVYVNTVALPFIFLTMLALITLARSAARMIARTVAMEERLLVLGSDADARSLDHRLERSHTVKARVIARIPIGFTELPYGPARLLSQPAQLERVIEKYDISRIILMPGSRHSDEVADVVRTVRSIDVKLDVLPGAGDAIGAATLVDDVAGLQMFAIRDNTMSASSRMAKRALDIAGASFGLLVLSPLMLAITIAIKLDSRGPVLYKQRRIGRDGRPFEMLKFRSMVQNADAMKQDVAHLSVTSDFFKIDNDPRVTRVGSFIRRTSLDELPQLLNVVRGNMSLVGPRPLVPEEDTEITGWYRRRSHITPGITGAWQLLGTVRIPLEEMAKLDYMYVANWSLWSDVKILLRTVGHVLGRRGL